MKYIIILILSLNITYSIYQNKQLNFLKDKNKISFNMFIAMINCNRYAIRSLQPYGSSPGSYPKVDSVMFPDVCIAAGALKYLYAVKYKNYVPEKRFFNKKTKKYNYLISPYAYNTGRIYSSEVKHYEKLAEEAYKEIGEILDVKNIRNINH